MNSRSFRLSWPLFNLIIGLLTIQCTPDSDDSLKSGFLNPPESSRPVVYWYFMDGNTSRQAMTADLESILLCSMPYFPNPNLKSLFSVKEVYQKT